MWHLKFPTQTTPVLGLRKMKALGHPNFIVRTSLKVITDHIEKESDAKKPEMIQYLL